MQFCSLTLYNFVIKLCFLFLYYFVVDFVANFELIIYTLGYVTSKERLDGESNGLSSLRLAEAAAINSDS